MQEEQTYIGRIVSHRRDEGYAFIGINGTCKADDAPHGLDTSADLFIHQDDCADPLEVGMKLIFMVVPDTNRGSGHYRAMGATEFVDELELVPSGEAPMEGFNALAPFGGDKPATLAIVPTRAQQAKMKRVDPATLELVLTNQPAANVPRDSSIPEDMDALMTAFLAFLFPALAQFGTHFRLNVDEQELERQVALAREDHISLGMDEQLAVLEAELQRFYSFRKALSFLVGEKLVRRDTIIPIQYLPDFFCAVPVWYHWVEAKGIEAVKAESQSSDPNVSHATRYFCNLFPNQNWADFYQMYNRRMRTLRDYAGDIIPPSVTRRIREVQGLFDHIVIMTPYHDVAGRDWQNLQWIRSIDPYVVGFKNGIPYFFIIARFSDSGTFPLFTELVADTIQFLRTNREKLEGFNSTQNPFWHITGERRGASFQYLYPRKPSDREFQEIRLGTHLQRMLNRALVAFEKGRLFDWLRGDCTDEMIAG